MAKELQLRTGQQVVQSAAVIFEVFARVYTEWYEGEYPDSYTRVEQIIRCHLVPFFAGRAIDSFSLHDTDQYKIHRRGKVKQETVTKELRTLKAMLNRAVKWKYLLAHPLLDLEFQASLDSKPPYFFSVEQLQLLYAANPARAHFWQFLANTGLRRKEVLQLRREHLLPNKRLHVLSTSAARSKSRKWREVPLNKSAVSALSAFPAEAEYLFPRVTPRSLSRMFTDDLARAGLTQGTIHDLRHTFCSHLVMAGVPLRTVQIIAGHSSVTVTEKYAHLAPGHLSGAVEAIEI